MKTKKILAVVLSVIMLLSSAPLGGLVGGSLQSPFAVKITAASSKVNPPKIKNLAITTGGKQKQLKLTWTKQSKATGYQVYRSTTGKSGSYKKIATLKSASKNKFTDKELKSAKTYYYEVRTYIKKSGKTYYGKFSKIDLSTRLTKSAIKSKFTAANNFNIDWLTYGVEAVNSMDYSDTIPAKNSYDPDYVRVKSKKYKSVSDLKKEAAKYFEKSLYEKIIKDYYADFKGKLYRKDYPCGGDGFSERGTLKVVSLKDKSCTFKITNYYYDGYSYTSTYKMIYKNGKWLFKTMP